MAAFLEHIGGREVDRDALRRQREADGGQRGAHTFARFPHRLVRQADNLEGGQAAGHVHLHIDIEHIDALEGDGGNMRDHPGTMAERTAAVYCEIRRISGAGRPGRPPRSRVAIRS